MTILFVEKGVQVSNDFFRDLHLVEEYLKQIPDAMLYS